MSDRKCKRILYSLLFTLFCGNTTLAQELYPMTEPASNIPKGTLGVRLYSESYREALGKLRNLMGARIMYGATPKLTVIVNATVSNHHNRELPPDFPTHNTPQIGIDHPYRFNGFDFYAKYRFLTIDGQNSHFRMAAYGEGSILKVAHDEAEPTLLDDTQGIGGGIIGTYLKGHFAASLTTGVIIPFDYKGGVSDQLYGLPDVPARVVYGRAINYSLSLGYLLFPKRYKNYDQTNWNIYVEFLGKAYNTAEVYFGNILNPQNTYSIPINSIPVLTAGNYVEVHPGLQCIIKSNLRIDFSAGFPLINKSYARYYPLFSFGIQRYFYFKHKSS